MRSFLLLILIAVSAVLLWAIWSQSYVNTTIFTLGLLATGLCGYLIADYFFNVEKKTWQTDVSLYKKEVEALKEELDILRKQSALATPQTEVDELQSRFHLLEEEKNKINGEFLAQAATISSLNTRLDFLQKEHNKLKEDATVMTESRSTEIEAIRDTLSNTKLKINELIAENDGLKVEIARYETEAKLKEVKLKTIEPETPKYSNFDKSTVAIPPAIPVFLNDKEERLELNSFRKRSRQTEESHKPEVVEATPISDVQVVENEGIKSETQVQNKVEISEPVESESISNTDSSTEPHPIYGASDDLKVIEGIGPKIESLLKAAGIENWNDLAEATVDNLKGVLEKAGSRYRLNDPSTWPEQAHLLATGEWGKYKSYTEYLIGGRKPKA